MSERIIPPPEPGREPLRVNVYQFVQNSITALAPLFPYIDEGSIVPCVASFRGGPGKSFGRFQHFNTVDEVVIMFGAQGGRGRAGMVRVGPKLHPVGAPFDNPEDPDAVRLVMITQRQLIGKPHREEYRFICDKCDRRLYLETIDATPAKRASRPEAAQRYARFITIIETLEAARHFNESEEARTCKHCGHVNDKFPIETWGWDVYAAQSELAEISAKTMAVEQAGGARAAGS